MKETQSSQELKEEILQKLSEEVKNRNWNDEDKFIDHANFDFRDEQQKRDQQELQEQLFRERVNEIM